MEILSSEAHLKFGVSVKEKGGRGTSYGPASPEDDNMF
jgi:hypothetical protein